MATKPRSVEREDEASFLHACLELVDEARDLRARGERAGFPIPQFLRRITGDSEAGPARGRVQIPRMDPPVAAPKSMKSDWIWVPTDHPSVQIRTVIKAVLRSENRPLTMRMLMPRLADLRGESGVSEGSVANVGTSLATDEKAITREDGAWALAVGVDAPELVDGYMFGPLSVFGKPEIAWFRRAAILHLLRAMPDGLQVMQVVGHLESLDWVPGPKAKDTIQVDLETLQAERAVRRVSHSKKWVLQNREAPA